MASLIALIPAGCGLVAGAFAGAIAGTFSLDAFSWWLLKYGGGSFVVGFSVYYLYRRKHPHSEPLDNIFDIAFFLTGITFAVGYVGMFAKLKIDYYLYERFVRGIVNEAHHLA